ncbi:hypothetical protein SBA4_1840011 [Candidatus Sulfopaludibacter sp. SbA4]|nr:hypothetical protein SBA4_1840011 [Candidatus Sulfopaludibacter sp. SbA4]
MRGKAFGLIGLAVLWPILSGWWQVVIVSLGSGSGGAQISP